MHIMTDILPFAAIIVAAGFLQGLTGFGFALIALPLLGLFLPLKTIIPLVCLLGGCVSLGLSLQLRRSIHFHSMVPLFAATVPAIPLGVYVLKKVPAEYLGIALGVLMICFTAYQLMVKPKQRPLGMVGCMTAGFLSGILGGSISAGGPPVIVYSAMQPWSKDRAKATLAFYFLVSGLAISGTHAVSGLITPEVVRLFAASLPSLAFGVWLGATLYRRISDTGYRRLAFLLVFVLGWMMLYRNACA
jgi:uncharacterized membrane protein YfcA